MCADERGIRTGDLVIYRRGRWGSAPQGCPRGRVVAAPLFDPYTATSWVQVRTEDAAEDAEPAWVRRENIIDVIRAS